MSKTPAKAAKTKADPAPTAPVETKPAAKTKAAAKVEAAPAAKAKTVEKPKDGAKPNALQQPLQPSAELAAIVGSAKLARGEVVSKVWCTSRSTSCRTRMMAGDFGGCQAAEGVRQAEGDDVRDEQASGGASQVRARQGQGLCPWTPLRTVVLRTFLLGGV